MAAERNYGRNLAAFCQGVGEEYGQVAVTSEVAGTTNAVHQLGAANMSGVYVTIDINFNSGVHCDYADTTSNFRAVGDFLRTEQQIFFVEIYVLIEFLLAFRRRSQSGTGSNAEFASVDQVEHTILNNFGVNGQVFEIGVNQTIDNCVSNGAYAGLQRQQVFRQTAFFNFVFQEVNEVSAHMFSVVVDFAQRTNDVRTVARNYCNDFFYFARNVGGTDAVFRSGDRNRLTIRGIQRNIGVMHAFQAYRLSGVNFNDNLFSASYIGRAVAHGSGRDQANHAIAEVVDFANFYDSNIRTGRTASHEAIANHLSHVRQMNISVFYFTSVDSFTHGAVGLIRQTTVNNASFNHCLVNFRTNRCASPNVNFERSFFALFSKSQRNSFRIARRGKTADT